MFPQNSVYYLEEMIKAASGEDFKGKKTLISGAGNVAQYAALKVIELGGVVLSLSDSKGALVSEGEQGLSAEYIDKVAELKLKGGYLKDLEVPSGFKYHEGARPWTLAKKVDVAIPSATQNEINGDEAKAMVAAGLRYIAEGANMPSTQEAIDIFEGERKKGSDKAVWYGPGKAANVSYLPSPSPLLNFSLIFRFWDSISAEVSLFLDSRWLKTLPVSNGLRRRLTPSSRTSCKLASEPVTRLERNSPTLVLFLPVSLSPCSPRLVVVLTFVYNLQSSSVPTLLVSSRSPTLPRRKFSFFSLFLSSRAFR